MSDQRLPNFVVAGAAKSGSTSLYEYIKGHPEIYLPEQKKESRYFASEVLKGTLGYNKTSVFEWEEFIDLYKEVKAEHRAIGDLGNLYMIYPEIAIPNIKEKLGGNVKVVFIIRNPVKRAYSAYQMARRNFYEELSFEKGLDAEAKRLEEGYLPCDIVAYQKMGIYSEPIKEFQKHFPVHVIVLDDLKKDPQEELKRLYSFLGVSQQYEANTNGAHNKGGELPQSKVNVFRVQKFLKSLKPILGFIPGLSKLSEWFINKLSNKVSKSGSTKAEPLSPEMEEKLKSLFAKDVKAMSELLNRDLESLWGFRAEVN